MSIVTSYLIRNTAVCACCRELGAKVLIDDNPIYAVECANAGIHVLLYDWHLTYPWSKTADGYDLTAVHNLFVTVFIMSKMEFAGEIDTSSFTHYKPSLQVILV